MSMRKLRLVSGLGSAALALMVVMASSAAASPEFSPAKGNATIKSGKDSLTWGALGLTCTKGKGKWETVSATHTNVETDLEGCVNAGLQENSVGDAAGIVLTKWLDLLCYLAGSNKASPKVGLYSELSAASVTEAGGIKFELKGQVIGVVEPINIKVGNLKVVYAKTNPAECTTENEGKGTAKHAELLANAAGGKFEKAEEVSTLEVTFEKETEVKA